MLITTIWQMYGAGAPYFFLCSKDASGKWREHPFHRKDLKRVASFLKEHSDRDLYFCPHGFSKPKRIKDNAVAPRLLWSDMDKCDPRSVKWKPTIAIESSPGRYVGLWLMDREVTEELNRRLSYSLDVDISGWDYTQVLRVPGTTNYKYDSMPRTRIKWSDGKQWDVSVLDRQLPKLATSDNDPIDVERAREILKKYKSKLRGHTLSAIRQRNAPSEGKRSEVLHRLFCECFEAGMKQDEAICLLGASVWNKFAGRRTEISNLEREWEKAAEKPHRARQAIAGEDDDDDEEDNYEFLSTPLSEIKEEPIDWIWYPYLARGEITILQGDPEAGKSFISQHVSAHIAGGLELPCYINDAPPVAHGVVAYFDIENSSRHVTTARLRWGGYRDLSKFIQDERPFSIDDPEAMKKVYAAFERVRPVLAVFDTMNTYIGRADTNNGAQSQQSFLNFKKLAARFNCAVLVLRHLTKGGRDRAMYRGQGSIAFTGVARVELTAGPHPTEKGVRVMARSKGNLTSPPPALRYMIESAPTRKERDRAEFSFGEFDKSVTAEMIVAPSDDKEQGDKALDEAVEFLTREFESGPQAYDVLLTKAEARSIEKSTLQRAFKKLGATSKTKGFGDRKKTMWSA